MGALEDVDLRLGVVGSTGESLVRSFTGPEKPGSPRRLRQDGIKKEIMVDGRRYFLLLRQLQTEPDNSESELRTRQVGLVTKLIASSLDFRFRR